MPGERSGATMTHEEFARTVGIAEKQRTQEARTLPLRHGGRQVETTPGIPSNVEAEFYEGERKIQLEVRKITEEPSGVEDEVKNKTHSPVESAMAE
jgi:hypothetical protein